MSCMSVLNDYLAYLPMVYDSSMAVEGTKKNNVPLNEADLARIILNSILVIWVNQYNMTHSTLPKSPHVLLLDLETIKCIMNEKHQARLKMKAKEASSASHSAKGSSKKHYASGNPNEQVPKKERPAKFCQHCKSKGGPHLTHNINKCPKYNKDGNPVAAATGKPSEAKKSFKKGGNKQMVYKFSQPPEFYVETCTNFFMFSVLRVLTGWVGHWTPTQRHHRLSASHCQMPPPRHHYL
jgi:hypothetical protein